MQTTNQEAIMYRLTLSEMQCDADDFDTENGIGMPADVEPYELEVVTVPESMVVPTLEDWGVGQWDGGRTAYDPDGSHMSPAGVITERWASVVALADPETCGGTGNHDGQDAPDGCDECNPDGPWL